MNEQNSEGKKPASSIIDPRSPTNDYKRTPIHVNTVSVINKNEANDDYLNDSAASLDNSSLVMADSSILLQQGIYFLINKKVFISLIRPIKHSFQTSNKY